MIRRYYVVPVVLKEATGYAGNFRCKIEFPEGVVGYLEAYTNKRKAERACRHWEKLNVAKEVRLAGHKIEPIVVESIE